MNKKICFALDCHYENYVNMLKEGILKQFIDFDLKNEGMSFFISSNRPDLLQDYTASDNIFVYNIDDLRKNNPVSIEYEILPENPIGIYPSKFPWNLERFIVKEAALNGYDYIISLDSDVRITSLSKESFLHDIKSSFENDNVIMTNQAIFLYKNKSPGEVFDLHDKYINHFQLNCSEDEYNCMDGPVLIYNGIDNNSILNYISNWDSLVDFGYKKDYGFGYEGVVCGNWSLSMAMSKFKLIHKGFPFVPFHDYSARY
jgi:hypothetical protein